MAQTLMGNARSVAVIGSGGKTSLVERLGRELRALQPAATVAIVTTTHQWPPAQLPLIANLGLRETLGRLQQEGLAYVASTCQVREQLKLAEPKWGVPALLGKKSSEVAAKVAGRRATPAGNFVASFDANPPLPSYVLIEADGSRQRPLKAHASWEPAVPKGAQKTILVMGASGFDQPVEQAVHRAELFCARTGCNPKDLATPQLVAAELAAEFFARQAPLRFDAVFVNQTDGNPQREANARALAESLRKRGIAVPVWQGSARGGTCTR